MEYCKAMKKGLEGHDMLSLKKKSPVSDCFWKKKSPVSNRNRTVHIPVFQKITHT